MKWDNIKDIKSSEFKRITGFRRETFDEMVRQFSNGINKRSCPVTHCRPAKLSIEEQILAAIIYWKEYSSMVYIGRSFGVNGTTIGRIIHKVEDVLSACKTFQLPKKKKLTKRNIKIFAIVDATEIRIERPKKNSKNITQAKKDFTH